MSRPVLSPTMSSVQHHSKDGVSLHPCRLAALEAGGGYERDLGSRAAETRLQQYLAGTQRFPAVPVAIKGSGKGRLEHLVS